VDEDSSSPRQSKRKTWYKSTSLKVALSLSTYLPLSLSLSLSLARSLARSLSVCRSLSLCALTPSCSYLNYTLLSPRRCARVSAIVFIYTIYTLLYKYNVSILLYNVS
jgi:hypothetical protein